MANSRDLEAALAAKVDPKIREMAEDHSDAEILALRRFLVPINPDPVTKMAKKEKR